MTNDRDLDQKVRTWLDEPPPGPPDRNAVYARVMDRLPETRQRRHRWPFQWNPFAGGATRGAEADGPHQQGRSRTMLSPVKAIVAGALVFALGGVLLIAQPFDKQGSAPGAEQAAEHPAPVYVTGTHVRLGDCEEPADEEYGPVSLLRSTCTDQHTWSDPRLQGTETFWNYCIDYSDDPSELTLCQRVINIVTDDGAWRMRPVFKIDAGAPDGAAVQDSGGIYVLDGEDAYEGLSVVLAKDEDGLSGFIVSRDLLPPAPEEGSTK